MRGLLPFVLLLASACGSSAPRPAAAPAPVVAPVAPKPAPAKPVEPAKASYPGVPDTLAGEHLAWVLDAFAKRQGKVTRAEVDKRFDQKMLAAVSADQLVATMPMIANQLAGFTLVSVKGTEHALVAIVKVANQRLQIILSVEKATKQIDGLLLKPDPTDAPRPKTFAEALTMTEKLAPKAQLLVAELDPKRGGRCKPLHQSKSKEALAIGSTGKLYILLGLVDQILAGKAKWEDELAIRDDWKSLPSGITQNDKAGTKLTLQLLAQRMIAISDNTATDHLLYTVGRKQVEAAVRATKHGSPQKNVPFLGTRELFLFKLGMEDAEIEKYRKLPEAQRRAYLDTTLAGKLPDLAKAETWTSARRIDQLEWFANTDDLCRTMSTLWQRAQKPPAQPLFDVLSKNPGLEIDKAVWPFIGFKGGSEPGVMNLTWLLKRADDRWFVVAITANAPAGTVEESNVIGIALGVFDLLRPAAP